MEKDRARVAKSCGPKPFGEGEPGPEWGLEELGNYAQMQYEQIVDGETWLTLAYWRLGHALDLAKKAFAHGQWERHLEKLGIDKTRAAKARAIHRTFESPEDAAALTVEEAYARRQRRQPAANRGPDGPVPTKQGARRLRELIETIGQQADTTIDAAAFAGREEAVALIPVVHKAIKRLDELLNYLEYQVPAEESRAEQIANAP